MEDKLQSRCSRIGRRNTLWRPTKMSSPTVNCPRPSEREQKKSKPPHRASTRQPAARCSTGRGDADPGGAAERRSADGGQLGRPQAPAPCGRPAAATSHSGERQATRRPVAQRPAAGGPRARPHGARVRTRHAAPGARTARRGTRRSVSGSRQGRRQSPRGKSACARLRRDLRPGAQRQAGAAPPRQVTGRYDLVSILNFFDSVDL